MARSNTANVKFDVREVERLAKDLSKLSGETIGAVTVTALNQAIDSAYELSRERMNAGINLDDPYLKRFMEVRPATAGRPVATLTTEGRQTRLAKFSPTTMTRAAKSPPERLKGNPGLGIARGLRPNAVTVAVGKGSRKTVKDSRVFMNPGIRDTSGTPLVMRRLDGQTRNGKDRLEALLGPTPYQLFAYQMTPVSLSAEEDLETRLVQGVVEAIEKAISK